MLVITEAAAKIIAKQHKETKAGTMLLRLAVKAGNDGKIEYVMGFDEPKEHDVRLLQYDVEVIFDLQSADLIEEATMDYVEIEKGQFNFIFSNPFDVNYMPPKKG